jgi:Restriction endonuclease
MAESTLVSAQDLDDGAALVSTLEKLSFPVTAAFWVLPQGANSARLVIATPDLDRLGPNRSYQVVRSALERLGSGLSLSRLSLLSDNDSFVRNMANLTESADVEVQSIPLPPNEANKYASDHGYAYRVSPIKYERTALELLEGLTLKNARIKSHMALVHNVSLRADISIEWQDFTILIELKAASRPLGIPHVHQIVGYLQAASLDAVHTYGLLVSRSGFTIAAQEAAEKYGSAVALVEWSGQPGDTRFIEAIAKILRLPNQT